MNILVTGSRFRPAVDVRNVLDRYEEEITGLVVGDSTGADEAARSWAGDRGIPVTVFHAGPGHDHTSDFLGGIVAEKPTLCLAFPITGSMGTLSCVAAARRAGIPVTVIPEFPNEPARRTDGHAVFATGADSGLLGLTMRHVVERYSQALASSRAADTPPLEPFRQGAHHAGGPKPVVFGGPGRDPLPGTVMGAWARVADLDGIGKGSRRDNGMRYRIVSHAVAACDGRAKGYGCLEDQAGDLAFTVASIPLLAPCSVRTGVVIASSVLDTYGRAVSAGGDGFCGAVEALADGDADSMIALLLRR